MRMTGIVGDGIFEFMERSDENIKVNRVNDICRAIVPEEERNVVAGSLDVVHRLGRLREGENNQPARPVIMRFISRTVRDMTRKSAKKNDCLKKNNLRFKEDLTAFDKEAQNRLWLDLSSELCRTEFYLHLIKLYIS